MSQYTGANAEQVEATLVYENDEGDEIRYPVTMAYGNVGQVLLVMDTLDGEERPAKVGVLFEGDEDDEAQDAPRLIPVSVEALADMKGRIEAGRPDGEIPLEHVEKWIKGELL